MDVTALRMREATIVAGIWLTYGVGGLGLLYVALTWARPHRPELAVLFVFATIAGVLVSLLPRERIVRSSLREPFFLSWTMLDYGLLVIASLLDAGTASPLILIFFIPVVFSSMSYPMWSVVTVGLVSVLSYLAVVLLAGGSSLEFEVAFAISLACTAAMSAWQAQNHNRQHRALATVSRTDPLTGCLNRRGFEERAVADIGSMHRRARGGAMLVLDIDRFKRVNDTFGHAAGDELLCWVAKCLESVTRATDAVGRLGGDEFAVLFPEVDVEQARESANRVSEALAERTPASLGLAMFPDDGMTLEELTHRADTRLYDSRRSRALDSRGEALGEGGAPEGFEPSRAAAAVHAQDGFGSNGLWRAALDAMPARAGAQERASEDANLESALLDQIDASLVVSDMGGIVISWNAGAEALYGWSAEEAVGRSARELMVPEDASVAERLVEELRRDGRWDGEMLVRRKDGSTFTAYIRNRLILDDAGAPTAIVGVAVDVSERARREEEQRHDLATLATINRVEAAIVEERFVLYAQPIIDMRSGEAVQHELLLRMREPDGRVAAPDEFLPVAEQYALIGEIDWWVIRQGAELAAAGNPVELNISARSVGDPDVLEHVERCIEQFGVQPGMLVFEITETAILEDEDAARVFAERVRSRGCKIALDDFGTGYGTLTYLKHIPVDFLKLDIEFVRDLSVNLASRHVVQAIVALARDFGLETVAEGVEDAEALELLARFGVDFAQGYHIGRPAPFRERPGDGSAAVRVKLPAVRRPELRRLPGRTRRPAPAQPRI